jgi:hypothetical protein
MKKHIKINLLNMWVKFVFLYLIECIKHGYENNKFEIEARQEADKV